MLEVFIEGILFGLVVTLLSVGPVFFALIQTSLRRGFKAGGTMALGVMLSDLILIIIAFYGLTHFIRDPAFQYIVGTIGSIVLVIFGAVMIIKSKAWQEQTNVEIKTFTYPALLAKGFILNISNPSVIFFWIIVVGLISAKDTFTTQHIIAFFSASLLTVLSMDFTKVYIAQRIKNFINPKLLIWLYRIMGITLVGFGIFVFTQVI